MLPIQLLLKTLGIRGYCLLTVLLLATSPLPVLLGQQLIWSTIPLTAGLLMTIGFFIQVSRELHSFLPLLSEDRESSCYLLAPLAADARDKLRESRRNHDSSSEIVNEISHSVSELTRNAERVAQNTGKQSHATASTAAAVTEISQSIEEVTRYIHETRQSAQEARTLADGGLNALLPARQEVETVARLAQQTAEQVKALEARSTSVSAMSAFIRDLADQTNLLALNAAIEAARAGEHGRGFSVVAEEVRALAQRSHNASSEISNDICAVQEQMAALRQQMETVVTSTDNCVAATADVEAALNAINDHTATVSDQVTQIATSVEQQAVAARDISAHIEQVAQVAESNSAMAGETSAIAAHIAKLTRQEQGGDPR
jgi:methyl-accepting chemotaxis protein